MEIRNLPCKGKMVVKASEVLVIILPEEKDSEEESCCSILRKAEHIITKEVYRKALLGSFDELRISKKLSHNQLRFARWIWSLHADRRHTSYITESQIHSLLQTNVWDLFQLANLGTNLKRKLLEYVAPVYCNFHRLNNYFWLLPPDCVDDVLRQPLLDRGSMDGVLETLFQWAKVDDHRQYLPALLSHLDLGSMSPGYLLRNETWCNQWLNQVPTPNQRLPTHSWLQVEVDYRLLQASNSINDKKRDNNEQMLLKFYCQQESDSVIMLGYSTAGKGLRVLKDIPVVLANEMIAIGFDGCVYFLGGEGSGKVIKYNPATNSVISKGNLACPTYDAAVVQHNGIFYIVGKDLKSEPNYRLQSYNPATGQSEELASANCCCHQPNLFILDDVLHIVGSNKDSFLTIERYNLSNNAWITTNTMFPFSGPWHHAAVCLNKLYLCSKSVLTEENMWLVYDFVSEKWTEHPFRGGPSCVIGLWTIGNSENTTLLLNDEQSLLYTYEVMTSQWTVLPESISDERSGCNLKPQGVQTLYCGPIAESTQKQDLGPADVTIACGNLEFVAHHSILSGASPYFRAMLASETEEAKTSKVEFSTITAETFERILEFVYSQKTSRKEMLSVENILLDLEAAHLMEISDLGASCFSRLADNISLNNYDKLLKAAVLHDNKGFQAKIMTYLAKNLHRYAFNGKDLNMNAALFNVILYHPELDALSLVKTSILDSEKDLGQNGEPVLERMECWFNGLLPTFEALCSSCDQMIIYQNETEAYSIRYMQKTNHNERWFKNLFCCRQYTQELQEAPTTSANSYYPQYYVLFYGTCRNKHHTNSESTQRFYDDTTSEWIEGKKSFVKLEPNSPLAFTLAASYQQSSSEVQTYNKQKKAATPKRFALECPSRADRAQAGDLEVVTEVTAYQQQNKVTTPQHFSLAANTDAKQTGCLETICTFLSRLLSAFISLPKAGRKQTCQRRRYIYVFQVDNQNITQEVTRWCVNLNKIISMTKLHTPVFLLEAEGLHGCIYIAGTIGCCKSIIVQRYCPLTGTCECLKTPTKLYKCKSLTSKSLFVSDNYLYVISQEHRHGCRYCLWRYNPVIDQWAVVGRHPDCSVFQQIITAWEKLAGPQVC